MKEEIEVMPKPKAIEAAPTQVSANNAVAAEPIADEQN